jgi:hypothetical protein
MFLTGRNKPLYSLALRKIKSSVNGPMIHFNNDKTCKSQASIVSFFFAFSLMGLRRVVFYCSLIERIAHTRASDAQNPRVRKTGEILTAF